MEKGIFGVYKQKGITSHDVIDRLRKITGIKKIGHAGTLDPMAEGVLVVGIGREATKKLDSILHQEKEYIATIKFGYLSDTYDAEGKLTRIEVDKKPTQQDINQALKKFIGIIEQRPPIYSAIKIKGKPAYKYARAGKKIKLSYRSVVIKSIQLIKYKWPLLKISVVCGPGVYIRSLANDIGEKLSVGGYLNKLIRTRVGDYKIDQTKKVVGFVQNSV